MKSSNVVYTSSFYNMDKIPEGYTGISIAIGSPKFFEGEHEPCFMPTWSLVNAYKNGVIDESKYVEDYMNLIINRKAEVYKVMEKLKNKKVVYLCHEPKGKFCHRHIISKVLTEFGFECHEL